MLEFDYTNVLDSSVSAHGISQSAFEMAAKSTHLMVDVLESARTWGMPGFADLPYAGEFYDINAFDQPGVEYGKKLTFAMMGRPGFEKFNATIEGSQRRERAIVR
jgi:hypothetical protein